MKNLNNVLMVSLFTVASMSFAYATQCPTLGSNTRMEGFAGQPGQTLHNVNITKDPNNRGQYRVVCNYPGSGAPPTQMTWSGLKSATPSGNAWRQYRSKYQCVPVASADQCQFTVTTN